MSNNEETFLFAEEETTPTVASRTTNRNFPNWRVLIIDDEPEIHKITTFVLKDFQWLDRKLEFLHAYSAKEAKEVLVKEKNIALCLVDVVMESIDAGLELVQYIREELNNKFVRIVLRTGQPGYAPESSVVRDYDINDYKDKTELTEQKLHTLLYSTLRSYHDVMTIEASRIGEDNVIKASAETFKTSTLQSFTETVLEQISRLLKDYRQAFPQEILSGFSVTIEKDEFTCVHGIGTYEQEQYTAAKDIPEKVKEILLQAKDQACAHFELGYFVLYAQQQKLKSQYLLYIEHDEGISDLCKQLIGLFYSNVRIAFENHTLKNDIEEAQKEMVYRLSEAIENRSQETGGHIKRVAEMCYILAIELGYSEQEANLVRVAAPLHDIGKIAIPDAVLNKPGKLDADEWQTMQTHVQIGYEMLKDSDRDIMKFAAYISHDHHEKWDGSGYPAGKKGDEIHLLGRITAVVDVFDALVNQRCYKESWPIQSALDLLQKESGKHFDPKIIQIFIEKRDMMQEIQQKYANSKF